MPDKEDVETLPAPELDADELATLRLEEGRCAVMEGFVETVGKSCDRASLTRARAARKLAADAAML
jgi:hypothetical protein